MATSVSRKTQDLANTYFDFVGSATESLSSRWKSNEYYMTFSQAAVYPLQVSQPWTYVPCDGEDVFGREALA